VVDEDPPDSRFGWFLPDFDSHARLPHHVHRLDVVVFYLRPRANNSRRAAINSFT
jgi:hypothetical protein